MKRKSLAGLREEIDEDLKPELKKKKYNNNNHKEPSNAAKPINSNGNKILKSKLKKSPQVGKASRAHISLYKDQKINSNLTKENLMIIEESKPNKNGGITDKGLNNSFQNSNKDTLKRDAQSLKDFKNLRKLVKLTKLDDSSFVAPKSTLGRKKSKSFEIILNHPKAPLAKNECIKALVKARQQNNKAKKAPAISIETCGEANCTDISNSLGVENSVLEVPEVSIIQNLSKDFEDIPLVSLGARVPRRNPTENKWLLRIKQQASDANDKSNLHDKKISSPILHLARGTISSINKIRSPQSVSSDDSSKKIKSRLGSLTKITKRQNEDKSNNHNMVDESKRSVGRNLVPTFEQMDEKSHGTNQEDTIVKDKCIIEDEGVNTKMEDDLNQHMQVIEDIKKENDALAEKIAKIQREKLELAKRAQEKEEYLKIREMQIETIRKQLLDSESYRMSLHNYIQDLRGNLRIYCRVRPVKGIKKSMISYPQKLQCLSKLQLKDPQVLHQENMPMIMTSLEIDNLTGNRSVYYFDRVFDEAAKQKEVKSYHSIFEEIKPFIQSAVDGEKVCVLSYGQSGSGKTYTIEGSAFHPMEDIDDPGILPRAVDFIFKESKRLEIQNKSIKLQIACMEIYNEIITDLLNERDMESLNGLLNENSSSSFQNNKKDKHAANQKEDDRGADNLSIMYKGNKVYVNGLTWIPIKDNWKLYDIISKAAKTKESFNNSSNEKSLRGHRVYQVKLLRSDGREGLLNIVELVRFGKVNAKIPDDRPATEVSRMKKVLNDPNVMNKGLITLGRIIRCISEKKTDNLIPYRDSKLTRILQDSLGGNGKAIMFINICPSEENLLETKESLKFSVKACL